ncbi:MAG: aminotransferase DegT [Alphaproteobacteria bacterium HGW-Alphaproteobacteria-1]|jgi:aminotransferase in exopolysaccharide biosynthesis|nr:MAG: aminotransferase DegT [Alphaproteobacteria bacterium HGW-Alphaproteobacteria-1]
MKINNNSCLADSLIELVHTIFGPSPVPLHRPVFVGNERSYLTQTIDSNFVSSVGARVTEFEERTAQFTGCARAIATMNGTAALHMALLVAGVRPGDEVLSQALTFVATCNSISYIAASPVFIDVDEDTMGMSPAALRHWLETNTRRAGGQTLNATTGARIAACVPMHTFGLPCRIAEIADICDEFGITLVEDAAESLGSYVGTRHTGSFGKLATLSYNGNKIITTGGGGMIVTNDHALADRAKHLTTTAKVPHAWDFVHDEVGYNYRLPNLNAALGCAQMEKLPAMLEIKADIAARYRAFCQAHGIHFVDPIDGTTANYWLNALRLNDRAERDAFLEYTNSKGVMTRPIWRLMSELDAFSQCQTDGLETSRWLVDRIVNIPSSVPENEFHRLSA